ncbi:plasminogen-like [Argopecten irradians]|uniref:plasminogen-like n=1 Tax=Argopecten irradians TaxID=31199 RepID=UPI003720D051
MDALMLALVALVPLVFGPGAMADTVTGAPPDIPADFCKGKVNGNYEHPTSCYDFIACSNGYPHLMVCPANLMFNENTGNCEQSHADPRCDDCATTPDLRHHRGSYEVTRPFLNDDKRVRYGCKEFMDPEPKSFCPVSRCVNDAWTQATLSCSAKDHLYPEDEIYEGKVSCTLGGIPCQRWDSIFPHDPQYLQNRSDLHNWCQPVISDRPWCYTTDPSVRWDYCPFDEKIVCGDEPISDSRYSLEYPFNDAYSVGRYRCKTYDDPAPVAHCPMTRCLPTANWTQPSMSCSSQDCLNSTTSEYSGRVSCTWTGVQCQRWDSNTPHIPKYNQGRTDLENYCVVEGFGKPWCYTMDPTTEWDWCPVEECV